MFSSPWLNAMAFSVFLITSALSSIAHGQVIKAQIYTIDIHGLPKLQDTMVSYVKTWRGCEYRLEFNPSSESISRGIKEVAGDQGLPQRQTKSLFCLLPEYFMPWIMPSFVSTETTNRRQYEEQTTYYWSKVAREYAVRRVWITPPGMSGPPKLATDAVQPNVLTQGSFNNACKFREFAPACMRVWPHEGPKIHIKTGLTISAELIVHEFGHYAAGYIFGHQDIINFIVPAIFNDTAKLGFQEAVADMFKALVLHDARYGALVGDDGYGKARASETAKWGDVLNSKTGDEYFIKAPLEQAFRQALWGADASGTIKVNWRPDPDNKAMANDPGLANKTMANAFAYALAMNRGHRIDVMANSLLEWMDANEPKRADQIRRIFASHGFALRLGDVCRVHSECESLRCVNLPGAGCVPQDGKGTSGDFCTTDQQCSSERCKFASGKKSGVCTSTSLKLGGTCTSNKECFSRRCDNNPWAGCIPQDGTGAPGDFCSHPNQCRSRVCEGASSQTPGVCTSTSLKLGEVCKDNPECLSRRCDNNPWAGCIPQDGTGAPGDFCSHPNQCRSRVCDGASSQTPGVCTSTSLKLGKACTLPTECLTQRCDNRAWAGCVSQDGTGESGAFCTTHQQCRSENCEGASSQTPGVCTSTSLKLGKACTRNPECLSLRCDNRPWQGRGCIPQDGTGAPGDFCNHPNQCRSENCEGANGQKPGVCSSTSLKLGEACTRNPECLSLRCDNRRWPGRGCIPQDGTGAPGDFCNHPNQCRSENCEGASSQTPGVCTSTSLKLGKACTRNPECLSLRCDNRPWPGRGCIPQDGTGAPGDFCNHPNQCRSRVCEGASSQTPGVCTSTSLKLGEVCKDHPECLSLRCDNRSWPGRGCIPQDGTGAPGDFCNHPNQCRSRVCDGANGQKPGVCTSR